MKYRERNENDDYDEQMKEEEFFFILAESVNKLGQWCLDLFNKADKLLPTQEHI